ncbi:hypothetical protein SDC9_165361 [bioreactor metagenome]|uniref:Uncharacterized protein n=1 Tax=bioreactor metagenome TaxID=1076179 RepID=A0A645G1D3_9ZZZZ
MNSPAMGVRAAMSSTKIPRDATMAMRLMTVMYMRDKSGRFLPKFCPVRAVAATASPSPTVKVMESSWVPIWWVA